MNRSGSSGNGRRGRRPVKATAATGSSVTRLVTLSSVGDGTKKDAVKFIGKRA